MKLILVLLIIATNCLADDIIQIPGIKEVWNADYDSGVLYTVDNSGALSLVRANAEGVVEIKRIQFEYKLKNLVARNKVVYILGYKSDVQPMMLIVDATDYDNPKVIKEWPLPRQKPLIFSDMVIKDGVIYACDQNLSSIFSYDVSNPSEPALMSEYLLDIVGDLGSPYCDLDELGDSLHVVYGYGTGDILAIRSRGNLEKVLEIGPGLGGTVTGDYFVRADFTQSFSLFKKGSTPADLQKLDTFAVGGYGALMYTFINGTNLLIATESSSILHFDISNLSQPRFIKVLNTLPIQEDSVFFTEFGSYFMRTGWPLGDLYFSKNPL